MSSTDRLHHRIERWSSATIGAWRSAEPRHRGARLPENATVDCGWGRLIFAHTFASNAELAEAIRDEAEGRRNLALYLRDPHVVLAMAPQELFLDPSHTYRLWLSRYRPGRNLPSGFVVRRLQTQADAQAVSRLLDTRDMVSPGAEFIWSKRSSRSLQCFVAEEKASGQIVGTVSGVDHAAAFSDPENGSSLWALAVDPQARQPGVGRALVSHIADHFCARGRSYMDLSVMHDNAAVIRLYEDLGFERIPVFCIKKKNAINEPLYVGRSVEEGLNPYADIIVREARRRGIGVEVLDADNGYFALSHGGRRITCRESLTELCTAIAMSRCDNKLVTHRVLASEGLNVPRQQAAEGAEGNRRFVGECGAVVVKPARGEQGQGISVNLTDPDEVEAAVEEAAGVGGEVVLEEYVGGQDLRIVVIDYKVVAAAVRRPATVLGTGRHTIEQLISKQSRRRAAATGGEAKIPLDESTRRCLARQGLELGAVPESGREVQVRDTANLHTGGTLHDVTSVLHGTLRAAAERAARALAIPVVGLDLIVEAPNSQEYVIIEANERPGLANHEPQPTAERFVDLLFPETAIAASGGAC